jgi:SAM-dependent methyltransferase
MEIGLDHAFLEYIGITLENQIPTRRFYLPLFAGCRRVADLGCGYGSFVALLQEAGIEAVGVDSDPVACEAMRAANLPVVEQDVITYLQTIPPASLDGIYSAHLVEHLPYETVLELIRLSRQALEPGGRLLLATPDPRALVSHLEFYHMHFGHKAFYHPRLLSFFLDYCGFEKIKAGENPYTSSWLLSDITPFSKLDGFEQTTIQYRRTFPLTGKTPLHWFSRWGKNLLFKFLVQPMLDDIVAQANQILAAKHHALEQLGERLSKLDGPFECYALGYKPLAPAKEP